MRSKLVACISGPSPFSQYRRPVQLHFRVPACRQVAKEILGYLGASKRVTLDFTQPLLDKNGQAVPMNDCRKIYLVFAPRFERIEEELEDGCFLTAGAAPGNTAPQVDDSSKWQRFKITGTLASIIGACRPKGI
jgi:hypothetical protein